MTKVSVATRMGGATALQETFLLPSNAPLPVAELCRRLGERHLPTPEQTEVIEAPLAPRVVVAGAGSGKTQTMGLRVVWLVANGLVQPGRVLGLTFTRKAAGELGVRVRRLLRRLLTAHEADPFLPEAVVADLRSGEPQVSTYHSYAGGIVDEHGLRLGLEPSARLLGEAARWQYAQEVVSAYDGPMDAVTRAPSTVTLDVLALSAELSEHLTDVSAVRDVAASLRARAAALPSAPGQRGDAPAALRDLLATLAAREQLLPMVESLARLKLDRHARDFGDQVAWAARLAESCPEVARQERERFGVVLLDEYQDTGEAQRRLLRSLFGRGWPVVAVGDPRQSIYGWRGASAGNLERFPRDFAGLSGHARVETPVSGLTVSFRNGEHILAVANSIADGIPVRGFSSEQLSPGPGREATGTVQAALLFDVEAEARWIAGRIAGLGGHGQPSGGALPRVPWGEIAVLARKRSALPLVEQELRARGVPCEVVGLGGLLLEPEIVDLTSVLRVLVDPLAGNALLRLLTGPRWRMGPRDLAALAARARALVAHLRPAEASHPVAAEAPPPEPSVSIVDALDDLGPARAYSSAGYERLCRLRDELRELRAEIGRPLPELCGVAMRAMRLDVEVASRPGVSGPDALTSLHAFMDVADDFAESARRDGGEVRFSDGGLTAFLAYLRAAEEQERGLAREESDGVGEASGERVSLMTVHAAKGLEWDAVFVAGMCEKVFPVEGQAVTDWTRQPAALPFSLRGDREELPALDLATWTDTRAAATDIVRVRQGCKDRSAVEELRLAYVAVTRARALLVCSGFWWDLSATKPRGPSAYLLSVRELATDEGPWASPPAADENNPVAQRRAALTWPQDPLGDRRPAVEAAAALVRTAGRQESAASSPVSAAGSGDPRAAGWAEEVELLLAERQRAAERRSVVELPASLSVSALVALRRDPDGFARMLRRPVPMPPAPVARRGTHFHQWLEQRWGQQRLLDMDQLPGAADDSAEPDDDVLQLQQAFRRSTWDTRRPTEIEFPFELPLEGVLVRGRIDAVFTDDPSGVVDVVDWKTGDPPRPAEAEAAAVQLAAYRLAWHVVTGTPLERIRAAFHYVRANRTVRPVDLLDADGLAELLRGIPLINPPAPTELRPPPSPHHAKRHP